MTDAGINWNAIVAIVAVAALVGGAASWALTQMRIWRHRPQPDWLLTPRREGADFLVKVQNVGDGAAFEVDILSESCFVSRIERIPIALPGYRFEYEQGNLYGPRLDPTPWLPLELKEGGDPVVIVRWTASPTRLGRRWEQRLPIGRLVDLLSSGAASDADSRVYDFRRPRPRRVGPWRARLWIVGRLWR